MKNHRSLRHIIMQAGGLRNGAHRAPSAGIASRRAARGILVLALSLVGAAAIAMALPGHVSAGHAQVSAQHRANSPARPAGPAVALGKTTPRPWMY